MTYKKVLIASADSMGVDLISHTKNLHSNYSRFQASGDGVFQFSNLAKIQDAFPVWPDLLSNKLSAKCINVSMPGIGNRAIYERCIKEVSKHNTSDIELVVVMWSEYFRVDIRTPGYSEYYRVHGKDPVPVPEIIFQENYLKQLPKMKTYEYLEMLVDINFTYIYGLQQFLKNQNINYLMISGLNPVNDVDNLIKIGAALHPNWQKYLGELMLKSHFYDLIDPERFIGFPGDQKLMGFSYCNYLASLDKEKTKTRLGWAFKSIGRPFDMHPNAYGHKLGAELLYENYKKIN